MGWEATETGTRGGEYLRKDRIIEELVENG